MAEAEKEFRHQGLWSFLPWIWQSEQKRKGSGRGKRQAGGSQRWTVFAEPATMVDPGRLEAILASYDAKEPWYLGHGLTDEQMSIVHHYQQEPAYPLGHSAFALSEALLRKLVKDLEEKPIGGGQQIEPIWELANRLSKLAVHITDRKDAFCLRKAAGCATWARDLDSYRPSMGLSPKDVVIAVKTVGKFHQPRIPLLKEFWADDSPSDVLYLSNQGDDGGLGAKIVDLSQEFGDMVDPSKESTKHGSGHCSKMLAILRYLKKHQPQRRWYVVTDDDTLLNVPRLLRVLDSHDDKKAVYLGERYGWSHTEDHEGTNYITTGAGMALTAKALQQVVACSSCTCRSPDSPDDMSLGSWFRSLGVQVTHEEGFHQSEPHNYHKDLLAVSDEPISFHRYNALGSARSGHGWHCQSVQCSCEAIKTRCLLQEGPAQRGVLWMKSCVLTDLHEEPS
ncbi:B3GLCT [Symbiodinium necroappetens]|uniref:B3GLCT protein n=1 Tax=Symbiodinium necroappetens TaxID=1628268 RepID=A0A812LP98_9DINO|nr:B3GLCT [Symbiodinium necroappetens]